jgi:hypothetical protein
MIGPRYFSDHGFAHQNGGLMVLYTRCQRNGGEEFGLTLVVLKDRGAAQLTEPVNINFGQRVHPPPKLRRLTLQRMIRPRYFSDHG